MSKVWILLIQLAAFLFCGSNATESFTDQHLNVLNEVHTTLKENHYEKYCSTTRKMNSVITKFILEFCGVQENENALVCDHGRAAKQYSLIKDIKEFMDFAASAWDHNDPMVSNAHNKVRTLYCDQLISSGPQDDDEETRIDLSQLYGSLKEGVAEVLHDLSNLGKYLVDRGQKLILKNLVSFNAPQCSGDQCQICVSFKIPELQEVCIKMKYSNEDGTHSLLLSLTHNGKIEVKHRIIIDDLTQCIQLPGFLGKICVEAKLGKIKVNDSKPQVNFCAGFLADKLGVGLKVCASYANGALKFKFTPKLFPGAKTLDNDILEMHSNKKSGVKLHANEFN